MIDELTDLIKICNWMNKAGFSPATSGNYSVRIDEKTCYVSASGVDKGQLGPDDFVAYSLEGIFDTKEKKPSDEAPIHARIYQLYPEANCVLHAHSVANTVVSLKTKENYVEFEGFEMQKAFVGIKDHEQKLRVDIVENTQDIHALAKRLEPFQIPCFILRGHGLYVWGANTEMAKRHLEGIEFLLQCKLELMRLT